MLHGRRQLLQLYLHALVQHARLRDRAPAEGRAEPARPAPVTQLPDVREAQAAASLHDQDVRGPAGGKDRAEAVYEEELTQLAKLTVLEKPAGPAAAEAAECRGHTAGDLKGGAAAEAQLVGGSPPSGHAVIAKMRGVEEGGDLPGAVNLDANAGLPVPAVGAVSSRVGPRQLGIAVKPLRSLSRCAGRVDAALQAEEEAVCGRGLHPHDVSAVCRLPAGHDQHVRAVREGELDVADEGAHKQCGRQNPLDLRVRGRALDDARPDGRAHCIPRMDRCKERLGGLRLHQRLGSIGEVPLPVLVYVGEGVSQGNVQQDPCCDAAPNKHEDGEATRGPLVGLGGVEFRREPTGRPRGPPAEGLLFDRLHGSFKLDHVGFSCGLAPRAGP
mmetsp:Transcript_20474/g.64847  ORF Transcript_20474/g.64847 Transcript_20474/m.64847 type:complete len:386 (-) Transcript_20474:3-1160(-)